MEGREIIMSEEKQIVFSLCHTTIRLPDGWRRAAQTWLDKADHPELVEHILVIDRKDDSHLHGLVDGKVFPNTSVLVNDGVNSCVAGWNLGAKHSTGKFIINIADDWFPCDHWDTELLKVIDFEREQVIEVNTGGNHGLLTFCMMTRQYYKRYGYLLYPEYLSVYSDNEFTDVARRNGVITSARHLLFPHEHPLYDHNVDSDEAYEWQSRPEAWEIGRALYQKRSREAGIERTRPKLIVCLPGQAFSYVWVSNWTNLLANMMQRFELVPIFGYSSNVYVTRATLAQNASLSKPKPEYLLWVDDDNILTAEQFNMLFDDLRSNPDIDCVSGWSWIQNDVFTIEPRVSVGHFNEKGTCVAMRHDALMSGTDDIKPIEWTGFPAVLMRYSCLEQAGGYSAFFPLAAPGHPYGYYGEDSSFSMNALRAGCHLYVDRRVRVPHLKLRDAEPILANVQVPEEAVA